MIRPKTILLTAQLLVAMAAIPALAQWGERPPPRINCADWHLNEDGSWQPRRDVTIGPVTMGPVVHIYQSANLIIAGVDMIPALNRQCGRTRRR